ncbi:hypothetical protein ABPG72_010393 [Tetrahymena utriculariae]
MGNVTASQATNTNNFQKDPHRFLQKFTSNDGLTFIQFQNIEGIQTSCRLYQKKNNEIWFSVPVSKIDYQASQFYNQESKVQFNERVKLQHINLISCLGIDTLPPPPQQQSQIQEQSLSDGNNNSSLLQAHTDAQVNENTLYLMYEYNTFSLEALISERLDSNRLFPEDDLLNLAKSILNILNFLQRQNIPHGDIHPSSIYFNTAGNNFAIYDRDFLCGRCVGMRLAESGKKFSYLSPEQITLMRSGSNVFTSNEMIYKADIFCLGMTLLEAASLRLSQECYDENYSILAPVINERLLFIQNYYSPQFCYYLKLMLDYDVRKRLDPLSLWNKLQNDNSISLPTNLQNNIMPNQLSQNMNNNQKNAVPQFGGEQRTINNANQKQQQTNTQNQKIYQKDPHTQSQNQYIVDDQQDQEWQIFQKISQLQVKDNDFSLQFPNSIDVQDSAHFRTSLNQNQMQQNPMQNNSQMIQAPQSSVLKQSNIQNSYQIQVQQPIQQQQQQLKQQSQIYNYSIKNSQVQQQAPAQQSRVQLNNMYQQVYQQNNLPTDQQQQQQYQQQNMQNRAVKMNGQSQMQFQNQMIQQRFQQPNFEQRTIYQKQFQQQQEANQLQNQSNKNQNQSIQQQQQSNLQNQRVNLCLNPNQIQSKERSSSLYSQERLNSKERTTTKETGQSQLILASNPNYEQSETEQEQPNKPQESQNQQLHKSILANQFRQHSVSLLNGSNPRESTPKLEHNPSQILRNLQEQQQEIQAQYLKQFGKEANQNQLSDAKQQSQKEFTGQKNIQILQQQHPYQSQFQQPNASNFDTQDIEIVAPENDPNTSTNMIVQSQNVIKFKHPRQQSQLQSFDQNSSNTNNSYSSYIKILNQPQTLFPQPQLIASVQVSPQRENNSGKILLLNAQTKPYLFNGQRADSDNHHLQSKNIGNNQLIQPSQTQSNRTHPQRSQSFVQYPSNQQLFDNINRSSQNFLDENNNQKKIYIQNQQNPQIITQQAPNIANSMINQNNEHLLQNSIERSPFEIITGAQIQEQQADNYNQNMPNSSSLMIQGSVQPRQSSYNQQRVPLQQPNQQKQTFLEFNRNQIQSNTNFNLNEQQSPGQTDNNLIKTQIISPTTFKTPNLQNQDKDIEFFEQPKRTNISYSQIPNEQNQYFLSPVPTNNNARYSEIQTSNSQIFSTVTKQAIINKGSLLGNSNMQSQSVVIDTSQNDIQQQINADTELINNKRVLQSSNLSNFQENQQVDLINKQFSQQKQQLAQQIPQQQNQNENRQILQQSNLLDTSLQQNQNKLEIQIDRNKTSLSPNNQSKSSSIKLNILLNGNSQNKSKIVNQTNQEPQTNQIQSYQPSLDLNERVKQVIARSQAIRKTFE